jgi:hypothetical protein
MPQPKSQHISLGRRLSVISCQSSLDVYGNRLQGSAGCWTTGLGSLPVLGPAWVLGDMSMN